jgi:oligo-1,6-glucosidase
MMRWWVDRGVDGFRMDVINFISKSKFADGAPPPGRARAHSFLFTANGPRLDEFLVEMNVAVGLDERNLLTVGEMPGSTIDVARRATDPANHELNMVFTFEHVSLDYRPDGSGKFDMIPLLLPALKKNLAEWQLALADVGWNSLYWDNHDQPRAVSRFGNDSPEHRENSAKTLATVQHMHKGTPYIYQGEEIGMTNTYFTSIEQYRDIESINYHTAALSLGMEVEAVLNSLSVRSRDNARTPMQWNANTHAGFTDGIPWLGVNPNYITINAAAEIDDPNSVFHYFRKLIKLRHDHRVIVHGRFELLLPDHEQLWALTRTLDDQVLVMIANCSSEPTSVPIDALPDLTGAQVLLATHGDSTALDLQPWESRIYLLG